MTVATLEEMMEHNGGEEVTIRGEERWVTRDERSRPVLGPKRHRRKASSLRMKGSGRVMAKDNTENAETQRIVKTGGSVPVVTWGKQSDPEPKSWVQRQRDKWHGRFYDDGFHAAVTHAAADVIIWSVAGFCAVAAVKGIIWVVML